MRSLQMRLTESPSQRSYKISIGVTAILSAALLGLSGSSHASPPATGDANVCHNHSKHSQSVLSQGRAASHDLGTLGGDVAFGSDIEGDHVVGFSSTSDNEVHAFIWSPRSGMVDVGAPEQGSSHAVAVNRSAEVAGVATTADGNEHAFRWTVASGREELGDLGGSRSAAVAINTRGSIIGYSRTAFGGFHAFRWTPTNGIRNLGTLGGSADIALGINNRGWVVGESLTDYGHWHAFLWAPHRGMRDLGTLGDAHLSDSYARAINGRNTVVGIARPNGETTNFAFRWTARRGIKPLLTPGGYCSDAYAINANGRIAGSICRDDQTRRAVVWGPRVRLKYLDNSFGREHCVSSEALAINNRGETVGMCQTRNQQVYAVRWTPAGALEPLGAGLPAEDISERGQAIFNSDYPYRVRLWGPQTR